MSLTLNRHSVPVSCQNCCLEAKLYLTGQPRYHGVMSGPQRPQSDKAEQETCWLVSALQSNEGPLGRCGSRHLASTQHAHAVAFTNAT